MKKFLEIIKKKWLIDNTKTTILVAFLIIAFLFINIGVNKLDLQSIDVTRNKLYSLSDDTKNKISELNQNVSIYFFGIDDSYTSKILATLHIHRLHDKRCNMRSLVWRSLFYLNFHYTIFCLLFYYCYFFHAPAS